MQRFTLSMSEDYASYLEQLASADGPWSSKSEAVRGLLDEHRNGADQVTELETTVEELKETIDEMEIELDRVHREKRQILELRDEHTDLVTAVETEVSLQEKRAHAGVLTRMKWFLTGMPDNSNSKNKNKNKNKNNNEV